MLTCPHCGKKTFPFYSKLICALEDRECVECDHPVRLRFSWALATSCIVAAFGANCVNDTTTMLEIAVAAISFGLVFTLLQPLKPAPLVESAPADAHTEH